MNIGIKIKQIRERLNLSQDEFAQVLNRSSSAIKKYEANKNITVDLLQDISDKLDVSMLSLFSNNEDLFDLFIDINNLNELPDEDMRRLEIEFNSYINYLLYKYK